MRRHLALLLVVLTAAFVPLAGCGSSSSSSGSGPQKIHFAKTKFVLHAGLAFGAFHRYIYKPYKAGTFRSGAPGRAKAFVKGGAAALFVYHELKIARRDAQASPALSKLFSPLGSLVSRFGALGGALKKGHVNPSEIEGLNGGLGSIGQTANGAGAKIREVVPKL